MNILKKIWFIPLLITLTGCNRAIVNNYAYTKVHLISQHKCYEISSWGMWNSGSMIQFTLKDTDTTLLANTQEAVLVKGICPYCG